MNHYSTVYAVLWALAFFASSCVADDGAVVKGRVVFDENRMTSWDGIDLKIPFGEIKTTLRQNVELPPIPIPQDWAALKLEDRQAWMKEFRESDEGKKLIAQRESIFKDAPTYEVKIENDGGFVVYDLPAGVYALQGRVDKEVNSSKFGYEVFAQIEILEEVDEVVLDPIQVAITPLLASGAVAPPMEVKVQNGKPLTLEQFRGSPAFVYFWITNQPSKTFLKNVQRMHAELKDKYELRLLNVCVDDDRQSAANFIIENELTGNHAFSEGFYHRALFDYGVRSVPSIWLIDADGKILMSQQDFGLAFRSGESELAKIVSDRLSGASEPTPAEKDNASVSK